MEHDCSDVLRLGLSRGSGVYRITPWNTQREVDVYCDMDTEGGGWTVFQRRLDGSVNFNRSFADYEQGFGSLDGEFWLGLSLLYSMTSRDNMTLRVDVSLQDGTTGFDEYSGFFISDPDRYVFNVNERINSMGINFIWTSMILLRPFAIAALVILATCEEDRLRKLEGQMIEMKAFQSYVMARLNTIEGDVGTMTNRVSKLESHFITSDNDNSKIDSIKSITGHTLGDIYTNTEINDITKTLTMYKHSFKKHKKELINVKNVFKDTLSAFVSNASSTVSSLVNKVSYHVQHSAKNISATLEKVNNTVAESGRILRSDMMVTIKALHSSWSDWSAWSNCDKGSRSRQRSCDVPQPLTNGICIGNDTDSEECVIHEFLPSDCSDVLKLGLSRGSGVYKITPWNTHKEVEVYCDMDTEGGGWTVFQRRYDGSVAFNRSFVDYERGFGSLDGEFWTGLGLLYTLTSRANMTLRIDMSLPDGTTGFDEYSGFYISPPDRYNFNVDRRMNSERMTNSYLLSDNSSRWDINHQPFSTYDRDVDNWFGNNCALRHGGGWWFNECMTNNLNGPYNSDVFYYYSFKGSRPRNLKTSTMMMRLSH
ncbi:angiopoietin-2-like [Mya arenaria]|uniref:angiopoietin-2-like n=1 Tax=Mya arenaria TaxID=6604 RepID=UPI0022E630B5|nr:angiopoietin-2-like [Mya arenaria]